MKKIILTSTGLENPKIEHLFLKMANKDPSSIKAIFIPTAAIDDDSKAVLPKCWNDLIRNNILEENIYTYNLDKPIKKEIMEDCDVIYFCGGNPEYLMKQINIQTDFRKLLDEFVNRGGVYIGVSAGSWIAAKNLIDGLHYVNCYIEVHQEVGTENGEITLDNEKLINLTNSQALVIEGEITYIMEE